ncbi:MAG: glycosyltransferase family 4 protein [Anaerolineae bacterium]|nr:glycosyltransferase family 4 protein [Anaerolineae bacterium]
MDVAVDASRVTVARRTGTERYALELLRALLARDTVNRYRLYFRDTLPAELLPAGPQITTCVIPWPRLWTHTRFAAALWASRPDVTFVPAHTLPFAFPGPAIVTIHDLGYRFFPEAHTGWSRRYLEWSTRHSARRATIVLADSEATRRDLTVLYGIPAEKVRVVYPGVDERLAPVTDGATLAAVRTRYGLPDRYLLFVGTLQPRKNIQRLVQAYAVAELHQRGIGLVLAGGRGWLYNPAWTAGVPGVVETGYVADDDLAALYSGAEALVFPSLYEGFGFPVLEAMHCGTPVMASCTSSLPELAGEAALLVDPLDVTAMAATMLRLTSDRALRVRLIAAGRAQAARFTWDRAADAVLAVLVEAAEAGRRGR